MITYRLADLENGPIGETFSTYSAALQALLAAIAEGDLVNEEFGVQVEAKNFLCVVDSVGREFWIK